MSGKGRLLIISFIAVAILSALGLLHLFALRLENGDMFPPYSSLRSDPLGCKALFLALEHSEGLTTDRNFLAVDRIKGLQGRTIYFLGTGEGLLDSSSDRQARELEVLARAGNRLVIALEGQHELPAAAKAKGEEESEPEGNMRGKAVETGKPQAERRGAWGLKIGILAPPFDPNKGRPRAMLLASAAGLPATIPVHSRHHLEGGGQEWQPVYGYDGRALVLERSVGRGSIVLLAESYLFSNEAMRSDRCPGLLAWLQGHGRAALFDESHLGVYDTPGVMALVKKHRLVPFLMALLVVAALYVWKSAVPFVRVATPAEGSMEGSARDNFSGLVNLLRRNITPGDLITACFREWSRSFAREVGQSPDLARELRAVVDSETARPAGKRNPLEAYRKMAGLLSGFRMK